MNKRKAKKQWKKQQQKLKEMGMYIASNILYKIVAGQIVNRTISDDCGIRIKKPEQFKARKLGEKI